MVKAEPSYPDALLLRGGRIISGDGEADLACGSIRIRKGLIVEVKAGLADPAEGETLFEAQGLMVLPGFINAHAHGLICGPSMPSGSMPFSPTDIQWQRNRHLLSGTTSLLNVCGLALMDERDGSLGAHPAGIFMSSAHTPQSIAAADQIDGRGLSPGHRSARIEDLIKAGCRVLGEAGGGQTLGGGAQDYRFIPDAVEARTGIRIAPIAARRLKEAILGRHLDGEGIKDRSVVAELLHETGLQNLISPEEVRVLLIERVLSPVKTALAGLWEVADAATETGLPAIFHHAAPTAKTLLEIARSRPSLRMIAAHANHPSFTAQEAIDMAHALKEHGATIDISTLDMVETRYRNSPDNFDALVRHGLVDTISTDYAGGDWDTIGSALHQIMRRQDLSPAKAMALATGNVARVFPEIFGDRGLLKAGKRADILLTEAHNVGKTRHVLINGRFVVWNGALVSDVTGRPSGDQSTGQVD